MQENENSHEANVKSGRTTAISNKTNKTRYDMLGTSVDIFVADVDSTCQTKYSYTLGENKNGQLEGKGVGYNKNVNHKITLATVISALVTFAICRKDSCNILYYEYMAYGSNDLGRILRNGFIKFLASH